MENFGDQRHRFGAGVGSGSDWRKKEATRDAVEIAIHNHLFSDDTGLPVDGYDEEEVQEKKSAVFRHVLRVYPELPSPFFGTAA